MSRYRKEGRPFIWTSFAVGVIFGALGAPALAFLFFLLSLFFVFFFRDPERDIAFSPEFALSPADGKVMEARSDPDGTFVSIFMSVFDCHVNRSPYSGVVKRIYRSGSGFKAAFRKDSDTNVSNTIELETACGTVSVVQITGLLARRILCWVSEGQRVEAGERIGMIAFGSRVDLHLPGRWELFVRRGMKVKAGETIIGRRIP